MKELGLIILAILVFMYVNMEISSMNPCSNFSHNPSECNSDRM